MHPDLRSVGYVTFLQRPLYGYDPNNIFRTSGFDETPHRFCCPLTLTVSRISTLHVVCTLYVLHTQQATNSYDLDELQVDEIEFKKK